MLIFSWSNPPWVIWRGLCYSDWLGVLHWALATKGVLRVHSLILIIPKESLIVNYKSVSHWRSHYRPECLLSGRWHVIILKLLNDCRWYDWIMVRDQLLSLRHIQLLHRRWCCGLTIEYILNRRVLLGEESRVISCWEGFFGYALGPGSVFLHESHSEGSGNRYFIFDK